MVFGEEGKDAPVEVGPDLVGSAGLESVALCAAGLEETGTLLCVTCDERKVYQLLCFHSQSFDRRDESGGGRERASSVQHLPSSFSPHVLIPKL